MPEATINGHQHFWEDEGTGTPLVMLHGAAGSGLGFASVAAALAGEGLRVIVPDMRAMGRSEHVPTIPPSAWVDDVLGLLDHLGVGKAVVHGISLGSRVALRFAIDHPDRTLGCILDAAIIANDPAGNAALNTNLNPSALPEERKQAAMRQHGEDWEQVMTNYFQIRNEPELQEYYNLRAAAPTCEAPVLIIRGDNVPDAVHPLNHSIELHTVLPNSQLAIYPNGQSNLTNANPEVFVRLTKQFVSNLEGVAAG